MITPRNALVLLLVTKLCTCQSTPNVTQTAAASTTQPISTTQGAVPLTVGPLDPICSSCYIEAATSNDTLQAATDIVFTAYSATSVYTANGHCLTTRGGAVVLSTFYTVTRPTNVAISVFGAYAASEFIDYMGFSNCPGGIVTVVTVLAVPIGTPTTSASLPAAANSTTSSTLQSSTATNSIIGLGSLSGVGLGVKIGVGTAVTFLFLILICLAAYIWHKRRLRSAAFTAAERGITRNKEEKKPASEGDNQPYLQQKAELETKERRRRRRHELEGRQKMHELDGETEIREIPAGIHEDRIAVMRSRQELTGGEHSQELDA